MDYVDGKSVKDEIWCPGLVCCKGNGEAGLVVDVMGQAPAEFPVTNDNLTGFPGNGENLETVRRAVVEGLVGYFVF